MIDVFTCLDKAICFLLSLILRNEVDYSNDFSRWYKLFNNILSKTICMSDESIWCLSNRIVCVYLLLNSIKWPFDIPWGIVRIATSWSKGKNNTA